MSCSWQALLYCWVQTTLLLNVSCGYPHVNAVERADNATSASVCECRKSTEMFRILETIATASQLKSLTLITDPPGKGCGDLTQLTLVTHVTSCADWDMDVLWQSLSYGTSLITIVVDCCMDVTQSIIRGLLAARTADGVEKRLRLPVYNLIVTDQIELSFTLRLDVSAIHFVSVVRMDQENMALQIPPDLDGSSCFPGNHLRCTGSTYEIRRSNSGGPWTTVATYHNDILIRKSEILRSHFENFEKMHLKVTHSLYSPFTMRKNGVYFGFCIDLLNLISNNLNFTYELVYSIDKQFGVMHSNGTWNGMIGMMERKEVDLIVAGLTITYHREQVVDFTVPFYEEPSAVLVRTVALEGGIPRTYLFEPFQLNLWLTVAGSIIVCSILGNLVEQCATYVSHQPGEPNVSPRKPQKAQFSLSSSIWLMICSYARQGAVALPVSGSGRMSVSAFWVLALIIGWLYSANLTASLRTVHHKLPFNNLAELANDTEYTILMNGGSVQRLLLEKSSHGTYAALWRKIEKTKDASFMRDTKEALKLMFTEVPNNMKKYAVMADRTTLQTKLSRDFGSQCDWVFIPETFFTSGFGIALPDRSPYKKMFDNAVLRALETGLLMRYQRKNFYKPKCVVLKKETYAEVNPISIGHIKTILAVTSGGLVLAMLVLLLECILIRPLRNKVLDTDIQAPRV